MGDRYFLNVTCKECGFREDEVYYAPTCGLIDWECPECGTVVDLQKLTGISYEDASNRDQIGALVNGFKIGTARARGHKGSR